MIFLLSIQVLICLISTEDTTAKSSSSSLFNHHLNSLLGGGEFRGGGGAYRARSRKKRKSTIFSSTINTVPLEDKIDISQDYYNYNRGNDFYPIDQTAKTKTPEPLPPPSLPEYDWSEVELGTNAIQRRDTDKEGHRNTNNRVRLNIPIGDYHQDEFSESESDYQPFYNDHDLSELSQNNDTLTASNTKDKPVIYRYFGRSRAQSRSASIPFILIGPSLEHWKIAGQVLASRGFNVIACERVMGSPDGDDSNRRDESEGKGLVTAVLDALRWKKAILVGCDRDAGMAIEAAMRLAPDRIAGLVLCGDMRGARDYVTKLATEYDDSRNINEVTTFDDFLMENVGCPSTVVWDGDMYRWLKSERKAGRSDASVDDIRQEIRIPIVGGGSSPHRRLPEHFAWVLSRFVEQKVNFGDYDDDYLIDERETSGEDTTSSSNKGLSHRLSDLSIKVLTALAPESSPAAGRVLATAIIYGCTARIGLYHYQILRSGITGIKSKFGFLTSYGLQGLNFIIQIGFEDLRRKYSIIKLLGSRISFRSRHSTSSIDDASSASIDSDNTNQFESNRDEEEDARRETKISPVGDAPSLEHRVSPLTFLLGLDSVAT